MKSVNNEVKFAKNLSSSKYLSILDSDLSEAYNSFILLYISSLPSRIDKKQSDFSSPFLISIFSPRRRFSICEIVSCVIFTCIGSWRLLSFCWIIWLKSIKLIVGSVLRIFDILGERNSTNSFFILIVWSPIMNEKSSSSFNIIFFKPSDESMNDFDAIFKEWL